MILEQTTCLRSEQTGKFCIQDFLKKRSVKKLKEVLENQVHFLKKRVDRKKIIYEMNIDRYLIDQFKIC